MSKENMEKYLHELELIAKEACNLGLAEIGRGWENLTLNIKVYNADNSSHQSAKIFGVSVSLFKPTNFQLKLSDVAYLKEYAKKASAELKEFKASISNRHQEEALLAKTKRIAQLKKDLERLESNA